MSVSLSAISHGVHSFCYTQPVEFTREDAELLFGPDADYKAAFEELDTDEDGEVRVDYCSSSCNPGACPCEPSGPLLPDLILVSMA